MSHSPLTDAADRRIVLAGVLLATIALSYFYCVGNFYLSASSMSPIFKYLLMVDDFNTAWLSLGICVAAACWKNPAPLVRLADLLGSRIAAVVVATVILGALGTVFIYHNVAFSMDEYAAVFQAKVFAAGRLTGQLPPSVVDWLVPSGFNGAFLVASRVTGRAIEAYWPGFSLLLAPFELLGIPWLCNPLLTALAIFLIHRITLDITNDSRSAGWAVLFALGSGVFAATAISYYSMQAHLAANLLFVWLLLKPTPLRAFSAGLVGSFALVLHNPFPHAMFAAPWILAIARSRGGLRPFLLLSVGYLPLVLLLGVGWMSIRHDVAAGDSGFDVVGDLASAVFSFPSKSMIDMRVAAIVKMWIWAVPCLFLFAFLGRLRRGEDQRVRLLAQSAVLTFVGYVFVIFDQGHGWGYRYFHSAWGVIPILAACCMPARGQSDGPLSAFAGAAAVLSILIVVPFQLMQIDQLIGRHSAELPPPKRPGGNVYFVKALGAFYAADLVQTDPFLRDTDLILVSRGAVLDAELRRQNWPNAVLVGRVFGVEEWNIGDRLGNFSYSAEVAAHSSR